MPNDWRSTIILLAAATIGYAIKCDRRIANTTIPRSPLENKFHIFVRNFNDSEHLRSYIPRTKYLVTLEGTVEDGIKGKFTRFLISTDNTNDTLDGGSFDIINGTMLADYSPRCPKAVVETTKVPKEDVSVIWTSPPENSGCIIFRATVMETADIWYMDEGGLVLTLCQDSKVEEDDQGPVLPECCACDEAKYEVTFEGLWSRNTHPKDFPSKGWLIKFSDVIGASHTVDYRFWEYNGMASEGLQQVAEYGLTRRLESELKNQSEHIRTIIKARGISYPNVTGRTFAVFRVDRRHHLMSLVSMLDPSPDWIVGVSGLELCLENCSWIEHKELNLYPYDAGTDDGITYMSPDSPSDPKEPIRRITSTFPNDERAPFFDPTGQDMKPLAKLYLNRQRLYEKTCDDVPTEIIDTEACRVSSWGPWGPCSVTCGKGNKLRQRRYRDEAAALTNECNTTLTDRVTCFSEDQQCDTKGPRTTGMLNTDACLLEEWSAWSSCSSSCGPGSRTRSRIFRHKNFRKHCMAEPHGPSLQQTDDCDNNPCPGESGEKVSDDRSRGRQDNLESTSELVDENGDENDEEEDSDYAMEDMYQDEMEVTEEWLQRCTKGRYTEWSMWSPCSASCGPGVKVRSRLVNTNFDSEDEDHAECKIQQAVCIAEIPTCDFTKEDAEKICSEPQARGRCNGNFLRAYFDKHTGQCRRFSYSGCDGNKNNFPTTEDCNRVCKSYQRELKANMSAIMKNFKVSVSSVLSYHIPVQEQRSTKTKRARHADTTDAVGENASPQFNGIELDNQVKEASSVKDATKVDCEVSEWSKWSSCQGCRGFTTSTRSILVKPRNGEKNCRKKLLRRRKCHNIPPCSNQSTQRRSFRERKSLMTRSEVASVDCEMSPWTPWFRCNNCKGQQQYRTRNIKLPPSRLGKRCSHIVEFRPCTEFPCM
ncbi:spondin-1 isoform X2 [Orussus abietinus]|uniref:spondin-1 isoform X2 n=1 Tax=Orussus abietinus TaxID=222816 RepID=UPI000626CA53|nr:spondin-1 isoform X2 [Orussus abietinus]